MENFEFEPGNGTRYNFFINKTDYDHAGKPMYFHFAWMRYGPASGIIAKFAYDSFLHHSYVKEKLLSKELSISDADIAAIMAFIHKKTNVKVSFPDGYDDTGLWNPQQSLESPL